MTNVLETPKTFKDLPPKTIFAFTDAGDLRPYLKIEKGFVDMYVRTVQDDEAELERVQDMKVTILTVETLCVLINRDSIVEWIEQAIGHFMPEEKEEPTNSEAHE